MRGNVFRLGSGRFIVTDSYPHRSRSARAGGWVGGWGRALRQRRVASRLPPVCPVTRAPTRASSAVLSGAAAAAPPPRVDAGRVVAVAVAAARWRAMSRSRSSLHSSSRQRPRTCQRVEGASSGSGDRAPHFALDLHISPFPSPACFSLALQNVTLRHSSVGLPAP